MRQLSFLVLLLAVGCVRPSPNPLLNLPPTSTPEKRITPTPTLAPTGVPAPTETPTIIPTIAATVTPFYTGPLSPPCGLTLPILPETAVPLTAELNPDPDALAELREAVPETAAPALDRLLLRPDLAGLAAYRVGQETEGVYLNADAPMPLASVVKVITLAAYAEAVAAGELGGETPVPLADLEPFYLPGLDLGAHERGLAALAKAGRILPDETIRLEDVARLMIEFSSNAAADYLHLLLGQERIEQTAVTLGLATQTAPCPFLGQFLAMSNHTRRELSDYQALDAYLAEPAGYGREAMLLVDAFRADPAFRALYAERGQRPSLPVQRRFSDTLNPQASAGDYAGLMARLAQNGLSGGDSSFIARRLLEWPMQYPANQELFSNLGFKNGALPGVLTVVYYAYPIGETTPVVVALFFRDVPNQTYQRWRRADFPPHDELARWLLVVPAAIPILRRAISP